jgi:hypothetical protein
MSAITSTPIDAEVKKTSTSGRLFFLDLSAGRILSANPDGSNLKTIINEGRKLPYGLVLDVASGHIYWTNMGDPKRNDGSIMRSDLNGKNMIAIVPPVGTFTPKQLNLEKRSGKLYWSDREGMRVMRMNLDGSEIETLVDTRLGQPVRRLFKQRWHSTSLLSYRHRGLLAWEHPHRWQHTKGFSSLDRSPAHHPLRLLGSERVVQTSRDRAHGLCPRTE